MDMAELEEKVEELQRYKREEERERQREHAKRNREMQTARRQLQREIKKTSQEARARAVEVEAIERTVMKIHENEERSIERHTQLNLRFQERITDMESKTSDKQQFLQERMTELGFAQGRLAHLQFALKCLDDNIIVPVDLDQPALEDSANATDGAPPALQEKASLTGPSLTATLRKEAERLRDEARRLERENGMLHEELKAVKQVFDVGPNAKQALSSWAPGVDSDFEASRAEPAPEPATLSHAPSLRARATSSVALAADPSAKVIRSWSPGLNSRSLSSPAQVMRVATTPSLTPALTRLPSPVAAARTSEAYAALTSGPSSVRAPSLATDPLLFASLANSAATTSRLTTTTGTASSRTISLPTAPLPSPATVGTGSVVASYPMPGTLTQPIPVQSWTWPSGLPVAA